MRIWRDVDPEKPTLGFSIRWKRPATAEVYLWKRLYRWSAK